MKNLRSAAEIEDAKKLAALLHEIYLRLDIWDNGGYGSQEADRK
jgi:hypothetical protein